ncbi:hypothetical protein [Tamlana sp. 2201CG12-4]|uniref:hypothetical protein n=1 Tax=Tamlana sp. 2201CG12-4 TaxID=3112582 RepID=UPI002DBCCDD8|nr:hypothetical protein [Tamlana sp. 2201CG12-4]
MKDFLLNNYFFLTYSVELLAATTGVILYKKYKGTPAKYFIFFLVYLTICDFLGSYAKYVYPDRFFSFLIGSVIEKNHWWTTSYWFIGAIMFFAFYYRKILETKIFKKIIKFASYAFLGFSIVYIGFNIKDFFNKFFPVISILGALIIFLCSIFYFLETLLSDRILTFYKSLNFYISAAIFIWWLIIAPLDFYDVYFTYEIGNPDRDWNFVFLRWQIYLFANIFMYSTFTFALIWCKPEND